MDSISEEQIYKRYNVKTIARCTYILQTIRIINDFMETTYIKRFGEIRYALLRGKSRAFETYTAVIAQRSHPRLGRHCIHVYNFCFLRPLPDFYVLQKYLKYVRCKIYMIKTCTYILYTNKNVNRSLAFNLYKFILHRFQKRVLQLT